MKYLCTMIDELLNKEYKLYQVNARELYNRIHKTYNLSRLELQYFNSEVELTYFTQRLKFNEKRGYVKDKWAIENLDKIKKDIEENTHIKGMANVGARMGYELMPLAISCEENFENESSKIELIDGFRRMFCMNEVPNIDILVKVYSKLDDREWINSMILYNSWKFVDGEKSKKYMDRGFQLGLFYRYGIRFMDIDLLYYDMFQILDIYTEGNDLNSYSSDTGHSSRTYKTLWNNSKYNEDILVLSKIFSHSPVFRTESKKGVKEFDLSQEQHSLRSGVSRLYEVFVSLLGEIRRYEYDNRIKERVSFDMNIFYDYLSDKSMQKHFVKLCEMSVDGFIINYIISHIREDIKQRVYAGMGYPYTPPVITRVEEKPVSFAEIKM